MQGTPPLVGNNVPATLVRFFFYFSVIFGFTIMLPSMAGSGHIANFREGNMLETAQFFLLVLTAGGLLFYSIRRRRQCGTLCMLLGTLAAFACFREQDAFFDKLPYLRWEIGAIPFLLACCYTSRHFDSLKRQLEIFISTRSFAMLWAGFIVAIPFAQLVGHGPFLESLMGDSYNRDYTRVIEESGELVGYFLLLAGSIECIVELRTAILDRRL